MFDLKNLLSAALVASLFFSASAAEARFGKSSSSSDSEKKEKKKDKEDRDDSSSRRVHDASPVRTHDASPVGSSRPRPPPPPPRERVVVVEPAPTYYVEPAPTYYVEPAPTYYVAPAPPPTSYAEPAQVVQPLPEPAPARKDSVYSPLRLGLESGPTGGGSRTHLSLALEGDRLGLDGRITGLVLGTDDGSAGTDTIAAASVHLTYAIVTEDRIRVRVEGGFTYAEAPELKVFGPSMGSSFEGRLTPHLDFELRLQATPFPYLQVDTQAALAVKFHPFALRAGWRTLLMDDAGLVDGEVHRDVFHGPFIGLGLFL
ncbi:hypothetical protein [Hyalangium gracile]|uniref:hypothetical protein n=1 Tax=Hyalangium gracile TaxID=394092 RepID=UPI001CCC7993|nr:hypothetical protein [Hyalangium gracile]